MALLIRRVAFISPSLAPYRVPLFNALADLPGLRVRLLLGNPNEGQRPWREYLGNPSFELLLLPSRKLIVRTRLGDRVGFTFTPGLAAHLDKHRYDLVVTLGWTMPNTWVALWKRRRQGLPVVLWDESIPHPPGRTKQALLPVIRRMIGGFDGYLAASSACIEYMVSLGADRSRVVLFPQVADNAFFMNEADRLRPQRAELKAQLGLPPGPVILFVGQLIPRKGVLDLLDAFRQLAPRFPDAGLVFVGDGSLRQELLARRADYGLEERVVVGEFSPQSELPRFYALADIFALPSLYDTFGVVVNEALASSLPVVTTRSVGAVANIVRDGVNGLVVEPNAPDALAGALACLLADEPRRAQMGLASRQIISTWTPAHAAQNFELLYHMCVDAALAQPAQIRPSRR